MFDNTDEDRDLASQVSKTSTSSDPEDSKKEVASSSNDKVSESKGQPDSEEGQKPVAEPSKSDELSAQDSKEE